MAKDLVNFGDFQDALHDENWRLFHSFLSFSLNSKMLSPLEVIKKAEEAYYEKIYHLRLLKDLLDRS
jgi:deoxyribodipyrimidine photolyase-related protein